MENNLGVFLKKLRGKRSLREISSISGLSHTYIRDLELGYNRTTNSPMKPSMDSLKRLAKAYNFPYEELLKKAGYVDNESGFIELEGNKVPNDISLLLNGGYDLTFEGHKLSDNDKNIIYDILNSIFIKYSR
ncbi:helix-turn-helix domain-containing protein [Ammoniphilus sp. CFH 90114]|uniref:helix-turn-helix domain-containing protein n=1 Tax=Ammoniphilus sp. CFH 90114 TaxID=2493665 RepID=UPI00100EEA27|nr:helix-turn-helix domain-containing protein [Ammoniphilus sp. CFH 90114]RXT05278.1 XRE family transcriptional regulator [Ammoniphilus sp. CFH 90114]